VSSFFAFGEDVLHRQSPGDTNQNPKAGIAKGLSAKVAMSQIDVGAIRCWVSSKVLGCSVSVENLSHRLSAFGHEEEQESDNGNDSNTDAYCLGSG